MAKAHLITADFREDAGKGASRRLRRSGWVPAVLYGAERPTRSIQLNHKQVILAASKESFFSSILDLDFNGHRQKVLVRDWHMHPVRQQMLHMDFMRIRDDEEINVSIPLHFPNQETSPAGKAADILISHHMSEIEVTCLPADLPENLSIDLANLEEDDVVHLSDIELPKGVQITALMHAAENRDNAVVSAQKMRAVVEEEPVAQAAEGDAAEGEEASVEGQAGDESAKDED